MTEFFSWRVIFWAIALIGLGGLAVTAFILPETRGPEARETTRGQGGIAHVGRTYLALLKDRRFLGLVFIGGLGQSSFFAYLAGSSVVFIEHFGLSPSRYSLVFATNAIAFIGGAQFNSFLMRRFGAERVVRFAISVFAGLTTLLFIMTLAGVDSGVVLWGMLFAAFGCLGLVIPSTAVLALEAHGAHAGTAAALMGTLQLCTGAAVIVLVSAFFDGTPLSMVSAIAACGVTAVTLSWAMLRRSHSVP